MVSEGSRRGRWRAREVRGDATRVPYLARRVMTHGLSLRGGERIDAIECVSSRQKMSRGKRRFFLNTCFHSLDFARWVAFSLAKLI